VDCARLRGDTAVFHLVGCGGTGARVLAPLLKILPSGSQLLLWDHDLVEQRNLLRQHFSPEDVGFNKALVLADRYAEEANRVGVSLQGYPEKFHCEAQLFRLNQIILGCTDSQDFRHSMAVGLTKLRPYYYILWIDSGNERRTGQVAMEGFWLGGIRNALDTPQAQAKIDSTGEIKAFYQNPANSSGVRLKLTSISANFPELLEPEITSDTPACGMRIDLQTVAVNQLAAAYMVVQVAKIIEGRESNSLGVQFSTDGDAKALKMQEPKPDGCYTWIL